MTTFKPFFLVSLLALALVSSNSIPIRALSKGEIGEHIGLPPPNILYLKVQTESCPNAGTTSNVSITLGDKEGKTLTIANLVDWNESPPPPGGYFQTGHLDYLLGPVDPKAFASSPCFIIVHITRTGSCPAWGLDYINVTSTVDVIQPITFDIGLWVTRTVVVNKCSKATTTSGIKGSLAI